MRKGQIESHTARSPLLGFGRVMDGLMLDVKSKICFKRSKYPIIKTNVFLEFNTDDFFMLPLAEI